MKNPEYRIREAHQDYVKEFMAAGVRKKALVDYKTYLEVVTTFMEVLLMFLIHGFTVHLPRYLGALQIHKIERKFTKKDGSLNLRTNWMDSNKMKQEIEARGGLLYHEWWEKDGKVLPHFIKGAERKNNGGEKWMQYYVDEFYFKLVWIKSRTFWAKDTEEFCRWKLWHLMGYSIKFVRDTKRAAFKYIKDVPDHYFSHANKHNEIVISECIQKFRDSRWKLDKRRY